MKIANVVQGPDPCSYGRSLEVVARGWVEPPTFRFQSASDPTGGVGRTASVVKGACSRVWG
jgi:hypothetical protein